MTRAFSFLCAALFLAGCSSDPAQSGASDSGANDAHAPSTPASPNANDAGNDGGNALDDAEAEGAMRCNEIANTAKRVTINQVATDAPAPRGGTIESGAYEMTDVTIYTGASGPTGASGTATDTIFVTGSTIQFVGDGQPATRTVTLATNGAAFTATDTCPDTDVINGSFTATATTLLIYLDGGTDDAGARTVVETFTKE